MKPHIFEPASETIFKKVHIKRAPLSDFKAPTTRILCGERLKDVKQIQHSITCYGLLSPLTVMRRGANLIVVNGKKRYAALRRMQFCGELPPGLEHVSYIMAPSLNSKQTGNPKLTGSSAQPQLNIPDMALLSPREKFNLVTQLRAQGMALMQIAAALYTTKQNVNDLLTIKHLSPHLQQAYFGEVISTRQACVFAAIPNHAAQDTLRLSLGPFTNTPEAFNDILGAIDRGDTVLDMGEDTVIILPSKPKRAQLSLAA